MHLVARRVYLVTEEFNRLRKGFYRVAERFSLLLRRLGVAGCDPGVRARGFTSLACSVSGGFLRLPRRLSVTDVSTVCLQGTSQVLSTPSANIRLITEYFIGCPGLHLLG